MSLFFSNLSSFVLPCLLLLCPVYPVLSCVLLLRRVLRPVYSCYVSCLHLCYSDCSCPHPIHSSSNLGLNCPVLFILCTLFPSNQLLFRHVCPVYSVFYCTFYSFHVLLTCFMFCLVLFYVLSGLILILSSNWSYYGLSIYSWFILSVLLSCLRLFCPVRFVQKLYSLDLTRIWHTFLQVYNEHVERGL